MAMIHWMTSLNTEISGRRFRQFSLAFALSYLIYLLAWMTDATEWLTKDGFHLSVSSNAWYDLAPFPLLPKWAIFIPPVTSIIGFILITVGRLQRMGWFLLFVVAFYTQNVDPITAFTMNKLYVVFFLLFSCSRMPNSTLDKIPKYLFELCKWTFLIHYLIAGYSKVVHGDWLVHTDVLWSQIQGHYRNDFACWLLNWVPKWGFALLMYGFLIFESTAILGFNWHKTRSAYLVIGIFGHLFIAMVMDQLIYFSLQMMTFYLLFIQERKHAYQN